MLKKIYIFCILFITLLNTITVQADDNKTAYKLQTREVAGDYVSEPGINSIIELEQIQSVYREYDINIDHYPKYLPISFIENDFKITRWIFTGHEVNKYLYEKQTYDENIWIDTEGIELRYEGDNLETSSSERWIETGDTQTFIVYHKQIFQETNKDHYIGEEQLITKDNVNEIIKNNKKWVKKEEVEERYYHYHLTKKVDKFCFEVRQKTLSSYKSKGTFCYYTLNAPNKDTDLYNRGIYYSTPLISENNVTTAKVDGFKAHNGKYIYYYRDKAGLGDWYIPGTELKVTRNAYTHEFIGEGNSGGWQVDKPEDKKGEKSSQIYFETRTEWKDYSGRNHNTSVRYNNIYNVYEIRKVLDWSNTGDIKEEKSDETNTIFNQETCSVDYVKIGEHCYKIKNENSERWYPVEILTKKVYKHQTLQQSEGWSETGEKEYFFEHEISNTNNTRWVKYEENYIPYYEHKKQIFIDEWKDLEIGQKGYEEPKFINEKNFIKSEERLILNEYGRKRYVLACQYVTEIYEISAKVILEYLVTFKAAKSQSEQVNWLIKKGTLKNSFTTEYGKIEEGLILENEDESAVCYSTMPTRYSISFDNIGWPSHLRKSYGKPINSSVIGKSYNYQYQIGETTEWKDLLNINNEPYYYVGFSEPEVSEDFIKMEIDINFDFTNYNENNLRWVIAEDYDYTQIRTNRDLFLFSPAMSFNNIMKNIDKILIWIGNSLGIVFVLRYFIGYLLSGDDPGQKKSHLLAIKYVLTGMALLNIISLIIMAIKQYI